MRRLSRKALLVFGIYAAVLAAMIVGGFLAAAVGIWAAVLWGVGILVGLALATRQRLQGRKRTP
jgi:hypothetical protein